MAQRFFTCEICGNTIGLLHDSGVPMECCGQEMTELVGNTVDAAVEKHVPVVAVSGASVVVTVGEVAHPMLPEHYIEWIYIKTAQGGQRKELNPGDEPRAAFLLADSDQILAAYAFCNLHSLWKQEV